MSSQLALLREYCSETSLPYDGNFRIDENIFQLLSLGPESVISARFCGESAWTVTAQVVLQYPDGTKGQFFIKSAPGRHGRSMLEGEYHAMVALLGFGPKPLDWGKYKSENPEAYFFISEYVDFQEEMPEPDELCSRLACLHRVNQSPTEQFGFSIPTCQGRVLQYVDWESNWTTFFVKLLWHVIDQDFEVNGPWEDLEVVEKRFTGRVVPRLLDALVEDGRVLKPRLIHGDLWEGNIGTSRKNGDIYLFDAACLYAHHEMDIAAWRGYWNKISDPIYTNTYYRYNPPSEPKDEWEDRNRLYSVYYSLLYSVNHEKDGTAIRQL